MTIFYSIYNMSDGNFSVCKETVEGELSSYGPFTSHDDAIQYINSRKVLENLGINTKEILNEYKKSVKFTSKHDKRANWH